MNRLKTWKMKPIRNSGEISVPRVVYRSFYRAAVLTAAFALVMTVATRYTGQVDTGAQVSGAVVHHSLENKQQHIEKTSFTGIFPLAGFEKLKPSTWASQVIQSDELQVKNLYSSDLFSRPPPSLS
jgi:hypothetical protein